MKIIIVSNFDNEAVSDRLIAENVSSVYGRTMVSALLDKFSGSSSPDFFRLVEDDYKLYEFKP